VRRRNTVGVAVFLGAGGRLGRSPPSPPPRGSATGCVPYGRTVVKIVSITKLFYFPIPTLRYYRQWYHSTAWTSYRCSSWQVNTTSLILRHNSRVVNKDFEWTWSSRPNIAVVKFCLSQRPRLRLGQNFTTAMLAVGRGLEDQVQSESLLTSLNHWPAIYQPTTS